MINIEDAYARLASLSAANLGKTAPNPNVGCLIVKDGEIVGRGATGDGGRPHAEAVAIADAGGRRLQCHHCGHRQSAPPACPDCAGLALQPQGEGFFTWGALAVMVGGVIALDIPHGRGALAAAAAVVAAARRWLGTPYRHQASVRGEGADCLGLVRGVWREGRRVL